MPVAQERLVCDSCKRFIYKGELYMEWYGVFLCEDCYDDLLDEKEDEDDDEEDDD